MESWHFDIAGGLQRLLESYFEVAFAWLHRQTRCRNVCFSGGLAMNSVLNGKISRAGPFESVYVPFAPDEDLSCLSRDRSPNWEHSGL